MIPGYTFSKKASEYINGRKWHQWINPFSRYAPDSVRLPFIPSASNTKATPDSSVQFDPNGAGMPGQIPGNVNVGQDYRTKTVNSETKQQTQERQNKEVREGYGVVGDKLRNIGAMYGRTATDMLWDVPEFATYALQYGTPVFNLLFTHPQYRQQFQNARSWIRDKRNQTRNVFTYAPGTSDEDRNRLEKGTMANNLVGSMFIPSKAVTTVAKLPNIYKVNKLTNGVAKLPYKTIEYLKQVPRKAAGVQGDAGIFLGSGIESLVENLKDSE